jgi:hypothetical protein
MADEAPPPETPGEPPRDPPAELPTEILSAFGTEEDVVAWAYVIGWLSTEAYKLRDSDPEWSEKVRAAPHVAYRAWVKARAELLHEAMEGPPPGEKDIIGDDPYHHVLAQLMQVIYFRDRDK